MVSLLSHMWGWAYRSTMAAANGKPKPFKARPNDWKPGEWRRWQSPNVNVEEMRQALSASAKLVSVRVDVIPVDVECIAIELGMWLWGGSMEAGQYRLDFNERSDFSEVPKIVVSANAPVVDRRWQAAMGIAHMLMDATGTCFHDGTSARTLDQREGVWANGFARQLLIPQVLIPQAVAIYGWDPVELAKAFQVPEPQMRRAFEEWKSSL